LTSTRFLSAYAATVFLALPVVLALTLGAPDRSPSPWFLPRYVAVGAYGGLGVLAPTVKVGWELGLIEQRTDFVAVIELGPSFGVINPHNVTLFWEHTLVAGVGVRTGRGSRFHWGLSVMAGPVLHGARFNDGTIAEQRWNAVIEGRAQAGADLGRVTLAAFVGYQQAWLVNPRFPSAPLVGGFSFGLLVNWR
jgi:hypothetical protein